MSGGGIDGFGVSGVAAVGCDADFVAIEEGAGWTGFAGVES
jgi:hypothetical protein